MRLNSAIFVLACGLLATACSASKRTQTTEPSHTTTTATTATSSAEGNGYFELLDHETFRLTTPANDSTYGYTRENPIKVSGGMMGGVLNERRFLNGLRGPKGQRVSYTREGGCCPFKSAGSPYSSGVLDIYKLSYRSLKKPIYLYINMYDNGFMKIPNGFTSW